MKTEESYEVANDKRNIYKDEIPMALCMVGLMSKQAARKPFCVLFDSGSSHTF